MNDAIKIVDKPWGRELWLAVTEKYALKILEVNKGARLSLQYHEKKEESWYIESGEFKITLGEREIIAKKGDTFHIPPKTIHRLEGVTDAKLIEVSTPELDDVVRIEDDYDRK